MGTKNKMLLGAFLLASSVIQAVPVAITALTSIGKYEPSSFITDPTHFKPGDKAPPLYLTREYTIKQWNLHSLPVPTAGTHWTYMGGTYMLVNDADAKTIRAYDGEIFYCW